MNDEDQERAKARDVAQVQVALRREMLIASVLEVLQARTNEQLAAALPRSGQPFDIRTIERVNGTLEWAAVRFVAALNDPALEAADDD